MAETHDARATDAAVHQLELQTLDRRAVREGATTPWGRAQVSRQVADGIVPHSTASHGGFDLDQDRHATMPQNFRNSHQLYEEDCEWAKVTHAFPHPFTAHERRCADQTLRNYYPDAYECVTRVTLAYGAVPCPEPASV